MGQFIWKKFFERKRKRGEKITNKRCMCPCILSLRASFFFLGVMTVLPAYSFSVSNS